jgi:nitrate/nitrite transport system permease protein
MSHPLIDPSLASEPVATPRRRWSVSAVAHTLEKLGLGFFAPFIRLAAGDNPQEQLREIILSVVLPILAIAAFMAAWSTAATRVHSESMKIPSPAQTWSAWLGILEFAKGEAEKEKAFYARMEKLAEKSDAEAVAARADLAASPADAGIKARLQKALDASASYRAKPYVGPPTFFDQIQTSLITIAVGFSLATVIAVPIGILCGLSRAFNMAVNPLIQIFKPVSPLAWLPIVFVFVTALYHPAPDEKFFTRALLISAGTVTLCSLWPTLINTAVGVASIDPDHMNVAKVLKLSWMQRLWKIVLPSALPLMFTGMRLSLGVGWMVLIAADMLAQNPGLGKFIWDTFQNGSNKSMAEIVCAVFAIGIIGFLLDRLMLVLQRFVSFEEGKSI